jgi:hypothetical protein
MSKKSGKKPWNYMAGTEGTGEYKVIGRTGRGKVGVRQLGNGMYRIRVEPFGARFVPKMAEYMSRIDGWKQPGDGGQNRFSKVVQNPEEEMKTALAAIGHNMLVFKTNADLPEWASALTPA